MNIKALNAQMRKDYHAAGYTGKNIIFAVLDTGAARCSGTRDGHEQARHCEHVA